MTIIRTPFGRMPDGQEIGCWRMTDSNGSFAEILEYGCTVRSIAVLSKDGSLVDVALGYDTLEEYIGSNGCLGATMGRTVNRIKGAGFTLNKTRYELAANRPPHHFHGGFCGFDRQVWSARQDKDSICFSLRSPDGDEGYPGQLDVIVRVCFSSDKGLEFFYKAVSSRDTIVNMTNHTYFNLDGSGTIYDQTLCLLADSYTENDETIMPTGRILPVDGTAMDFRKAKRLGDGLSSSEECVVKTKGYNSNFVLRSGEATAKAKSLKTGICLQMTTDQPGVQLYTANFLSERSGKNHAQYGPYSGFCLEAQGFPDAMAHENFPSWVLRGGEEYSRHTAYRFEVEP